MWWQKDHLDSLKSELLVKVTNIYVTGFGAMDVAHKTTFSNGIHEREDY